MMELENHPWLLYVGIGDISNNQLVQVHAVNCLPGYIPSVLDNYTTNLMIEDKNVSLTVWDTAGSDDYDHLRPLCYANVDVFVACFSTVNPATLEKIKTKWHPEIRQLYPHTPIILVGTKIDLRNDNTIVANLKENRQSPITHEQGLHMMKVIGAVRYIECSSATRHGIYDVMETAIRSVLFPQIEKKDDCILQ
eukprot:TRINITY_DN7925_c0_g1_i1.p1 TRINITY_DN7925_c0_g1~~TRINITY_DN7925_c0_g1_i1.p1  ORF type:complete len:194 (+),score=1.09 TRINITY_DN7925_c0_g1_i1:59-640(+)